MIDLVHVFVRGWPLPPDEHIAHVQRHGYCAARCDPQAFGSVHFPTLSFSGGRRNTHPNRLLNAGGRTSRGEAARRGRSCSWRLSAGIVEEASGTSVCLRAMRAGRRLARHPATLQDDAGRNPVEDHEARDVQVHRRRIQAVHLPHLLAAALTMRLPVTTNLAL